MPFERLGDGARLVLLSFLVGLLEYLALLRLSSAGTTARATPR